MKQDIEIIHFANVIKRFPSYRLFIAKMRFEKY